VLDEIRQCQDTVAGKFQTTPVRPQGTFEGLGLPADELSTLKNAQGAGMSLWRRLAAMKRLRCTSRKSYVTIR
jgi:hypothetical protein